MSPHELMKLCIRKTLEGIAAGQTPFGCAIAREGEILANCHNIVWRSTDITAHAEITALRAACHTARRIHLEGAIVVATCEPCPMCMSALHWARVHKVYYGATIADAVAGGFNELPIAASEIVRQGRSSVQLIPGLLTDECVDLFRVWRESNGRSY